MKCVICGKEIKKSLYSNKVLCSNECFEIDYWNKFVQNKDSSNIVRINGIHYTLGKETNEPKKWKGFAGRKFVILFNDGRKVTTTNLCCNGEIPKDFKDKLPNNAKFIEK